MCRMDKSLQKRFSGGKKAVSERKKKTGSYHVFFAVNCSGTENIGIGNRVGFQRKCSDSISHWIGHVKCIVFFYMRTAHETSGNDAFFLYM